LSTAGSHLPAHTAASGVQQEFGPAPPTPHGVLAPQVSGHVIICPQLLVAGPHALPAHAAGLSGVHMPGPQLFGPTPPPPHVLGETQVFGHVIDCAQLLVAGPHALPAHAAVSLGVQPQPFGPAPPPPHEFGETHVLGQVTASPQSLIAGPQALPAHADALSGVQAPSPQMLGMWLAPQVCPPGQLPQDTSAPQLLSAKPQFLPWQGREPSAQTPVHGPPNGFAPSA